VSLHLPCTRMVGGKRKPQGFFLKSSKGGADKKNEYRCIELKGKKNTGKKERNEILPASRETTAQLFSSGGLQKAKSQKRRRGSTHRSLS